MPTKAVRPAEEGAWSMPSTRFSTLITVDDWAASLGKLLNEVEEAIRAGEANPKLKLEDLLFEFIKKSPPAAQHLDAIAGQAQRDLLTSEVQQALAGIAARKAELKRATLLIKKAAEQAQKSKKELQFENVLSMLEKAKASLEALKNLEEAATVPDRKLLDRVVAVTGTISELEALANG